MSETNPFVQVRIEQIRPSMNRKSRRDEVIYICEMFVTARFVNEPYQTPPVMLAKFEGTGTTIDLSTGDAIRRMFNNDPFELTRNPSILPYPDTDLKDVRFAYDNLSPKLQAFFDAYFSQHNPQLTQSLKLLA